MQPSTANRPKYQDLVETPNGMLIGGVPVTEEEVAELLETIDRAITSNTHRTRLSHLRMVEAWAIQRGSSWRLKGDAPMPVALFAVHLRGLFNAGASIKTVNGRIDAMRAWHVSRGHEQFGKESKFGSFCRGLVAMRAEQNANGLNMPSCAGAVTIDDVRAMLAKVESIHGVAGSKPNAMRCARDRAIILLGFNGAFRRSELAALTVEVVALDLNANNGTMVISAYNTKTNKTGAIRKEFKPMPTKSLCPVHALNEWLSVAGITSGKVFRSIRKDGVLGNGLTSDAINTVVKTYGAVVASQDKTITAHSLRAGYATQSVLDGIHPTTAREQGGWKSPATFDRYARRARVGMVNRYGMH